MLRRSSSTRGVLVGILTGALALSAAPELDRSTVDVIVRGTDLAAVAAAVTDHNGSVEREIGLINAVSGTVPAGLLQSLRSDDRVAEVSADAPIELLGKDKDEERDDDDRDDDRDDDDHEELDKKHRGLTGKQAMRALGGKHLTNRTDFNGTGIDVAVIDSGIVATEALPESRIIRGINVSTDESATDGYGHGTAMAVIIAGSTGKFLGTAGDADVVDVKVADATGMADVSQVLAAIDWVVSNRHTDGNNIRVMSLSFGTDGTNAYDVSPLAYAVEAAWRHGIVVVVSAGNHGNDLGRLTSPAIDPYVIAVGAADVTNVSHAKQFDRTVVPDWSAFGDGVRNPDIVAPGRSILGGRAKDSEIDEKNPAAAEGDYILGSGTSQAAAFTAGIVASMLEARPSLAPDEVKALLTSTAYDLEHVDARQDGHGLLDLGTLFRNGRLVATPANATQDHGWSDGSGSLDGDRGSFLLERADGTLLTGENTIVGAFDRETWLGSTWTGSTWTGSTWTGSTWTGSTWTGSTWTGSTWTGSTWTDSTWTSVRWGE